METAAEYKIENKYIRIPTALHDKLQTIADKKNLTIESYLEFELQKLINRTKPNVVITIPIIQRINELYKTMVVREISVEMGIPPSTVAKYVWKARKQGPRKKRRKFE